MKILLVEDEQKLAQALSKGLVHEGYAVDIVSDGKKALTRIQLHRSDYDLKQHEKHSGKKLTYFDSVKNAHYHPFVIEPAAGADRHQMRKVRQADA